MKLKFFEQKQLLCQRNTKAIGHKPIEIFTKNQAVVKDHDATKITSRLVWVSRQEDIKGNEEADTLAKEVIVVEIIRAELQKVAETIAKWSADKALERWKSSP